jgi:hypothetical protein
MPAAFLVTFMRSVKTAGGTADTTHYHDGCASTRDQNEKDDRHTGVTELNLLYSDVTCGTLLEHNKTSVVLVSLSRNSLCMHMYRNDHIILLSSNADFLNYQ